MADPAAVPSDTDARTMGSVAATMDESMLRMSLIDVDVAMCRTRVWQLWQRRHKMATTSQDGGRDTRQGWQGFGIRLKSSGEVVNW